MNKEKGNQEFKLKDFAALAEQVKASRQRKKVVVAAAEDLHTLEGINQAYRKGMITPILVGNKEKIIKIMEEAGFDFGPVEIVPTEGDQEAARQAVALIGQGKGDVLMKGRLQTADLLKEVVSKEHGLACGGIMSHVGLFELPGYPKLMVITDGG
ncbi:MAG: phosphate acyltransferase, partial [Anaerovoracaceae bacterium]